MKGPKRWKKLHRDWGTQ